MPVLVLGSLRGKDVVEELLLRVKLGPVEVGCEVASDVDDALARSRLRARSLAKSIFSRALRCIELPEAALFFKTELGGGFDAAVIESRSLWNLRFDVAIASGMATSDPSLREIPA